MSLGSDAQETGLSAQGLCHFLVSDNLKKLCSCCFLPGDLRWCSWVLLPEVKSPEVCLESCKKMQKKSRQLVEKFARLVLGAFLPGIFLGQG